MILHRNVLALDAASLVEALAERSGKGADDDPALTNPTTGIGGCCARATTGHMTAPPSKLMNARRLMPEAPDRAS